MDQQEPAPMAADGDEAAEAQLQHFFAGRRPGWDIPPLHQGLQMSSDQVLADLPSRIKCKKCGRTRLYFCYDCLEAFTPTPPVKLPFSLYIVTHPAQSRANATGVHLSVLAPTQAHLLPMDEIPDSVFSDPGTTVLYPDDVAVGAEDLARSDVPVTNVIVVDSLWQHARGIMSDPRMANVRHVRIRSYRTAFWRFHVKGVPSDGLCTVEAVYFLCKELHTGAGLHTECHCFDDILWYFAFMHKKIHQDSRDRFAPPGKLLGSKKIALAAGDGERGRGEKPGVGAAAAEAERRAKAGEEKQQAAAAAATESTKSDAAGL